MILSWGKPTILVMDLTGTKGTDDKVTYAWKRQHTPAEGTTSLETSKGDKTEAKFEGGELEDVKYNKNTYALNYTCRKVKDSTAVIPDVDGVIDHDYAVCVIPEDTTCPGILIQKSHVSVQDSFSSADGFQLAYTHDALKPASGTQVKYGVFNVTGLTEADGVSPTTLTFAHGGTTYDIKETANLSKTATGS